MCIYYNINNINTETLETLIILEYLLFHCLLVLFLNPLVMTSFVKFNFFFCFLLFEVFFEDPYENSNVYICTKNPPEWAILNFFVFDKFMLIMIYVENQFHL